MPEASFSFPPHHIRSVTVDNGGWVVPSSRIDTNNVAAINDDDIAVTKCCRLLLNELGITLSRDVFKNTPSGDYDGGVGNNHADNPNRLQNLPHKQGLSHRIIQTIASVRKMGDTNADLHEQQQPPDAAANKKIRGKNAVGKVARLERQRKLRLEKETTNIEEDEGFVLAKNGNKSEPSKAAAAVISPDQRFAMTFNSLRIIIALLTPALIHPQRQDYSLKMKNGPSIDRGDKKKVFKHYLFFEKAYDALKLGAMKELYRDFDRLLHDVDLSRDTVTERNDEDGTFTFDIAKWIKSTVDYGQSRLDRDAVTTRCFRDMPSNNNADVESKLHRELMRKFDRETDAKQIALGHAIAELQRKLAAAISHKMSPDTRLTVYGSCLSGLTLEGSHDVDVSVYIPELDRLKRTFDDGKISASNYERKMRNLIYRVRDSLVRHREYGDSFINVLAVPQARVPVVKGVDRYANNPYSDSGHLHFDLCFLNDIAVVNSSLLREYSMLDPRVRVLMLCVKSFAKKNGISSAADCTFSSYSWLNLVVFYLQCIGFVPVLQCPELMEAHNFKPDREGNSWHSVNSLDTYYLPSKDILGGKKWKQPSQFSDTTIPKLLYGFFNFYLNVFPRGTVLASIRVGDCSIHKASLEKSSRLWRYAVEDPFETWDSHCPHDLGSHVNENGQKKIIGCLQSGLKALHNLLSEANGASTALLNLIDCSTSKPQNEVGNAFKPQNRQNGNDQKPTSNATLNAINQMQKPKPKKIGRRTRARLQAESSQNHRPSEDRHRNEMKASKNEIQIKENSKAVSKNVIESSKKSVQLKETASETHTTNSGVKSLNSVGNKVCWNCGEAGHAKASCPKPIDAVKSDANKKLFRNQKNRGRRNEKKKQQTQATS